MRRSAKPITFGGIATGAARIKNKGIYVGQVRDWDEARKLGVDVGDLRET